MKNTINVERAKRRISQVELGKEVGITGGAIQKIEADKSDPKVSTALKIAKFFGTTIDKIFFE